MGFDMNLMLRRMWPFEKCTIGSLFIENLFFAFTLEPPWKDNQHEVSCIPQGKYRIQFYPWAKYNSGLFPTLMDVPGRSGIQIHRGNTAADTEGCILVARKRGEDCIEDSEAAIEDLYLKMVDAYSKGEEVWIEVTDLNIK